MYDKVSTDLKFVEREKEVEKFWEDEHIFEKSIKMREGCKPYVFYDGPPTANGKPHIGHVETRVIKDMIPRYRAMKGYMVPRKAGWDTHGLPVELEVEKKLLKFVPREYLLDAHHWLILHGRYVCKARKPQCGSCRIEDLCEYKHKTSDD